MFDIMKLNFKAGRDIEFSFDTKEEIWYFDEKYIGQYRYMSCPGLSNNMVFGIDDEVNPRI